MDEREELALRRTIGRRIAIARRAAGMTQDDLGAAIDVDKQTVSNWERGLRSPNGLYLYALARALDCTADFLCGLSDVLEVRL